MVGRGNDFLYRQGVLCILEDYTLRVSDIHAASEEIQINLSDILQPNPEASASGSQYKLFLLHYHDNIVTICHEKKGRPSSGHIYVVDTKPGPSSKKRIIKKVTLESTYKLFARHTSKYLYFGTYSGAGSQGHCEWEIKGINLQNKDLPCIGPLQLRGFFGTDIGSTIAFEIHKDHFYAVSNQTSFEVEEIDWTSFYHCIRFPLEDPKKDDIVESNNKVWRRQHDEGVIHDSWTDLTLQFDEETDAPKIVEARREWQKSHGRQLRTFYISDFKSKLTSSPSSSEGSPVLEATTGPLLPYDDAYISTLDSTNNPNYAPAETRYNRNFHPENPPRKAATSRPFILARTKFRAYNYSCSSFLDLVEDGQCCKDSSTSCLRIRIGSRHIAPADWETMSKGMQQYITPPVPSLDGDVAYRHSAVKMWPPPASTCPCSSRLHNILNPPLPSGPAYNRSITGVLDERSLVYMVRSGRSYSPSDDKAVGSIVLIQFNKGPLPPKPPKRESQDQMKANEWTWVPGACRKNMCC